MALLKDLSVDGKGYYGIGASAVEKKDDLYTYLRITDIRDDGTLNLGELKSVDDPDAGKYLLKPNDIVFARTGASTGRNYFYDGSDGIFVYAGFLIKFSIDPQKVNPQYVKYYCKSEQYRNWISSFSTGSTRGNINAQTLGNMDMKMSKITLLNASCADQVADAVVNAANNGLWAGGGICGVIFKKAGLAALTAACKQYKTPLKDGSAVITPAFNITNAKYIIHAVGPNFSITPNAFKELFDAYYNSLHVLMDNGLHSISFPLISSGIFGGSLSNPVAESAKQCCRAYKKFTEDYPNYPITVFLCAFSPNEMVEAQKIFDSMLTV